VPAAPKLKVNISVFIVCIPVLTRDRKKIFVARKHTRKSVVVTSSVAPVLRASGSSQAGPSVQGGYVQAATPWKAISKNARSSFQTAVDSPSHVMTIHDTHHDSDSD